MNNTITDKKLEKYFSVTKKALDKAKIASPKKTHIAQAAKDYLDMANRYYKDAEHFKKKGGNTPPLVRLIHHKGHIRKGLIRHHHVPGLCNDGSLSRFTHQAHDGHGFAIINIYIFLHFCMGHCLDRRKVPVINGLI